MRALVPFLILCAVAEGCRCGPDTATAVTIRIKNSGRSPMFVDSTDGRLGVEIQRRVSGDWFSFIEQPACGCQACDQVCNGVCACAPLASTVTKLAPNSATERTWGGVVQVEGTGSCGVLAGPSCVRPENAPVDETFRAKLCYALSVPRAPSNIDAGEPFPGNLPDAGIVCSTKEFAIRDGLVELGVAKGAPCTQQSDCTNPDELCLDGECTTACPANDVPQLGAGWQVAVEMGDDTLFTQNVGTGVTTYTATGAVSNVSYSNGIMDLRLKSGGLNAEVFVTTPATYQVAFTANETVTVTVVDRSSKDNPGQRGAVIRDSAGNLLLAADVGQSGLALTAADTAPFSVDVEAGEVLGCASTDCGKELQLKTIFNGGPQPVSVSSGEALPVVVGNQAYKLVNAANFKFGSSVCAQTRLTPYVIMNTRQGIAP
ncbi:MAG: hypothetical protein ACJ790_11225 [Myxococcaceae bacterium]